MAKWNDLSMSERASIIKLGVLNGITNLDNIRKFYNNFEVNKFDIGGPKDSINLESTNKPYKVPLEDIMGPVALRYNGNITLYANAREAEKAMLEFRAANPNKSFHLETSVAPKPDIPLMKELTVTGLKPESKPIDPIRAKIFEGYYNGLAKKYGGNLNILEDGGSTGQADTKGATIHNADKVNLAPINYLHSYLNSPGFKQRLKYIKDPKERLQYATNIARNANKDVTIRSGSYGVGSAIWEALKAIPKMIIGKEPDVGTNSTSYDWKRNLITINKALSLQHIVPWLESALAHEYGHKVDPVDLGIKIYKEPSRAPKEYQDLHKQKLIAPDNIHDAAYGETYADLAATRYNLFRSNIYDSRSSEPFTEEHYNNYLDFLKKNNFHDRLIELFPKDVLIRIINEIAYNATPILKESNLANPFTQPFNQISFAKYGGKLNKFREGGALDSPVQGGTTVRNRTTGELTHFANRQDAELFIEDSGASYFGGTLPELSVTAKNPNSNLLSKLLDDTFGSGNPLWGSDRVNLWNKPMYNGKYYDLTDTYKNFRSANDAAALGTTAVAALPSALTAASWLGSEVLPYTTARGILSFLGSNAPKWFTPKLAAGIPRLAAVLDHGRIRVPSIAGIKYKHGGQIINTLMNSGLPNEYGNWSNLMRLGGKLNIFKHGGYTKGGTTDTGILGLVLRDKVEKGVKDLFTLAKDSPEGPTTMLANNILSSIKNMLTPAHEEYSPKTYTVKKGDSLWKIATDNNMALDELIKLNPQKKDMIHPNDVLKLEPERKTVLVNIREENEKEKKLNSSNLSAILGYKHNDNYVVLDKKNRKLSIYDKNNKELYSTSDLATGASANDYNTITYRNEKGGIKDAAGNNSTPAGITVISGISEYHGYPSFTRARINSDGSKEDIASSMHYGVIGKEKNISNGCIRMSGESLNELLKYITSGTRMYVLPEKEGSRFTLRGGELNFTADSPYGIDLYKAKTLEDYGGDKNKYEKALAREKEGIDKYKKLYGENWKEKYEEDYHRRFWDDYNINIDKSYKPLEIVPTKLGDDNYNKNVQEFARGISSNKEALQQAFNLSSYEYNKLAELALGIAEQETKFGTSDRMASKKLIGDAGISALKTLLGNSSPISRGITLIKMDGDNAELKEIYKQLGINKESINSPEISALATIARLAYMYNNEVKGRTFTHANGESAIDPYDALLYKWSGLGSRLKNKKATPETNIYVKNVHKYSKDFNLFEKRQVSSY